MHHRLQSTLWGEAIAQHAIWQEGVTWLPSYSGRLFFKMYPELLAPCTWHEYPGCYGFHTLTLCNLYLRLMGRKKIFTSFDIGMSTIWQYYNNIIQILIQNDKSLFCLWTNTHKQCHPGWSDKPVWSRRSYRVYTSAPTQELTNLYLYSTHYSAILFFYFDNLALNDQKLPTTCMKEMKKKRKFLKHSCYILVAIERGENVFETHSFGVICNKKRGESFL